MSSAMIRSVTGQSHTHLITLLHMALHQAKKPNCFIPSAHQALQQLPHHLCKLQPTAGNWPLDVVKPHVENPPRPIPASSESPPQTPPTQIQSKWIQKDRDPDIDTSQFRLAPWVLGE